MSMAKQKSKRHHSKPHGGGVSYVQRMAQQRAIESALKDEAAMKQADLWAKQDIQRGLWLMVCAMAEAFHIGSKRLQRDFFPVLDRYNRELQRMREEDGDTFAFEKLKLRAGVGRRLPGSSMSGSVRARCHRNK